MLNTTATVYNIANEEEALQRILYSNTQKGKILKSIKGGFVVQSLGVKCFMPASEYGFFSKNENLEGKEIVFSSLYYKDKPIISRNKGLFNRLRESLKVGDIVTLTYKHTNQKGTHIFEFKNGFQVFYKQLPESYKLEKEKNYKFKIKNFNIKTNKIYLDTI